MIQHPAFFKIFRTGINDTKMKIPVAFMDIIKQALPEKVRLKDRFGNIWKINIAKIGDGFYFSEGWFNCGKENSMSTGDLVVFEYRNDGLFYFKLYVPHGTEKHQVSPRLVIDIDSADDDEMETLYDADDDKTVSENVHDDDDDDDDETTNEAAYNLIMMTGHRDQSVKGKEVVQVEQVHHAVMSSSNAKGGPVIQCSSKWYATEIFQAGLVPLPTNPYFVTKVSPKRKADLFIPMSVIKDNDLDLNQEIRLVDPRKREYEGKYKKWKDGRIMISGGWSLLCRKNFVNDRDFCICEFVQAPNRRLLINVSFVRSESYKPVYRIRY